MNKLCILSGTLFMLVVFASRANSEMAIYGKLNKEIRDVLQDVKKSTTHYQGVRDVGNSESRGGLKGEYTFDSIKLKYILEMGFNSTAALKPITIGSESYDTGDGMSGRLRVRQAAGTIVTPFGEIILGQTFTAGALRFLKHDPLSGTGLGSMNIDQRGLVNNNRGRELGFRYRSRKDLLGYKSPNLDGFYYLTTLDENDSLVIDKDAMDMYWEHLVAYDAEFSLTKIKLSGLLALNYRGTGNWDNDYYSIGADISIGDVEFLEDVTFHFMFGRQREMQFEEEEEESGIKKASSTLKNVLCFSDNDNCFTRILAGGSYLFDEDLTLALTYSMVMFGEAKLNDEKKDRGYDLQVALGANYTFSQYVALRASYGYYKVKDKFLVGDENLDNSAHMMMFGTQVSF